MGSLRPQGKMTSIYLDHAAATPMRPEVRALVAELMDRFIANPSSGHEWGRTARGMLEDARERAGRVLHAEPRSVHFVRGGTESINLAVLGRVDWLRSHDVEQPSLLRSSVEHSAVRESMEAAERVGCRVDLIPVSPEGKLCLPDPGELRSQNAQLISVQWVNQETGMVLPVDEVAERCLEAGVPLHIDAVQAAGKVQIHLGRTAAALLSLSGHKIGGPRGTGALVISEGTELHPRLFGGGQERGVRPGTEDVIGAVGLALALELSAEGLEEEVARLSSLRDHLERGLLAALPQLRVHAAKSTRAAHILNLGVPDLPRDVLPAALDQAGIGVSPGSACQSGATAVSPVLEALYGEEARDVAPLRLSLGWSTTRQEVDEAIRLIPPVIERTLSA